MNDSTEMESAFAYRQFAKAWDLLEELIVKIQTALQSPDIIEWRIPGLQLEMARAYEALSRDEQAEATFAAAAESAKRVNDGPTSEELVQFALGEFYLRRRLYDHALEASQFIREGGPSGDAWLLFYIRASACVGLGLAHQAKEAAAAYILAAPHKDGAKRQMEALLGHLPRMT
jgi:tetratricopeptide (TPR) repeat protein